MPQTKLSPRSLAQLAAVAEGTARVGPLVLLPALLEEHGVEPDALISEAGVDPDLLADPESEIDFARLGRLLTLCAERTRCDHIGLLLGKRAGVEALGLIGLLAAHSPDVGTALRNLILHMHLNDRGAVPMLSVEHECAFLGYSIYYPLIEGGRHIYDGVMAVMRNVMKAFCGPDWRPSEVIFSHSRPSSLKPFRNYFQAPLRFDAPRTGLVFPDRWLARRLPGSNPELRRLLEQRVASLEADGTGGVVVQIRRILHNLVLDGRGSQREVTEVFDIHRRTLNRRMREHGLSVRQLMDEARYQVARQLLVETQLPVVDVAIVLGYSDSTAFTRAFRRWSGTTPSDWRSQHTLYPRIAAPGQP